MNFEQMTEFYGLKTSYTKLDEIEARASKRDSFKSAKKATKMAVRPPETKRKYMEFTSEDFDDPFKFAIDNLCNVQLGFKTTRHLYFYGAIRKTLQRLFESGIIQFHLPIYKNHDQTVKQLKIHEKQEQYSTLRWDQLYPGFYIWLAALVVCFIVFIVEILIFNIRVYLER